jgi:hypothetical protein
LSQITKKTKVTINKRYLIIEHTFFFIVPLFLIALHTHFFTITTQPVPSPLSLDAFFGTDLLCPMRSTALPQSVAEKGIAWIILHVVYGVKKADAKAKEIRLIGGRTRVVRARDATRGCRGGSRLVLCETT